MPVILLEPQQQVVTPLPLKYDRSSFAPWIDNPSIRKENPGASTGDPVDYYPASDGQDILIEAPALTMQRRTFRIRKGENGSFGNVAIIGGHYIGTDEATTSGSDFDTVWRIEDIKGDCWVEGVYITAGEKQDGFQIGEKNGNNAGNWYFQRCWWDNIKGPKLSPHGDFVQNLGPVGHVRVDNFYGSSGSVSYTHLTLPTTSRV